MIYFISTPSFFFVFIFGSLLIQIFNLWGQSSNFLFHFLFHCLISVFLNISSTFIQPFFGTCLPVIFHFQEFLFVFNFFSNCIIFFPSCIYHFVNLDLFFPTWDFLKSLVVINCLFIYVKFYISFLLWLKQITTDIVTKTIQTYLTQDKV